MRRILAVAAVFGSFAVGTGCKHVAGVCDCAGHPSDAVIAPPANPYATVGQPVGGTPVPEKMPAPAPAPMPGK